MARLKILKIDTSVDTKTMGGIAKFLTHSNKAAARELSKHRNRKK
jgi:hypothetical protein